MPAQVKQSKSLGFCSLSVHWSESWVSVCDCELGYLCGEEANSKHHFVYDVLPPTTPIIGYAVAANGQFFVGAQMTGSLEQTTQIILDISCVTAHAVYVGTNKTKIIWIKRELIVYPW